MTRTTKVSLTSPNSNLIANRPDLDPEKLACTRDLTNRAVRDNLVTGYEPLLEAVGLPEPDRHVLAAAIKARAQVIVTNNLTDVQSAALGPWDPEAKSPGDFTLDRIDPSRETVFGTVQRVADSRQNPPTTFNFVARRLVLRETIATRTRAAETWPWCSQNQG